MMNIWLIYTEYMVKLPGITWYNHEIWNNNGQKWSIMANNGMGINDN